MNFTKAFTAELKNEALNTRKILERVPSESLTWKPHEKSMTLGRLASHVAELPGWAKMTLETEELNFETANYTPPAIESTADILKIFDNAFAGAIASFENLADDSVYTQNWKLRQGDHVLLDLPKHVVIRSMVLNHLVHHRGQLSVYLRMLDIPIPGMYGPSADEM